MIERPRDIMIKRPRDIMIERPRDIMIKGPRDIMIERPRDRLLYRWCISAKKLNRKLYVTLLSCPILLRLKQVLNRKKER